jgi:hypothetical protein
MSLMQDIDKDVVLDWRRHECTKKLVEKLEQKRDDSKNCAISELLKRAPEAFKAAVDAKMSQIIDNLIDEIKNEVLI